MLCIEDAPHQQLNPPSSAATVVSSFLPTGADSIDPGTGELAIHGQEFFKERIFFQNDVVLVLRSFIFTVRELLWQKRWTDLRVQISRTVKARTRFIDKFSLPAVPDTIDSLTLSFAPAWRNAVVNRAWKFSESERE